MNKSRAVPMTCRFTRCAFWVLGLLCFGRGCTVTLPPQWGAPGGVSGKALMQGPLGSTWLARAHSAILALERVGVGIGWPGVRCQSLLSQIRTWLDFWSL
jgi:hypothetical protein